MEELELSENKLTGSIPDKLGDFQIVHQMSLWGNALSNSLPQRLYSVSRLWRFFVDENKLTGSIAMSLGARHGASGFVSQSILW